MIPVPSSPDSPSIRIEKQGPVTTLVIDRPHVRNAIDARAADELAAAFRAFESDPDARVAVVCGRGGHFCAGGDLAAMVAKGCNPIREKGDGPLGISRLSLSKPVIAAISGYAVAGGLELALFCDIRIAEESAVLGFFNRRWGLPLCNGSTVRLPRIVGHGRAMEMILTGRPVSSDEALSYGLVTRVVRDGTVREEAEALAEEMAGFPFEGLMCDRQNAISQFAMDMDDALAHELKNAAEVFDDEQALEGARAFVSGKGRHGVFDGR
ncbi:crotonase/enoyl-CoA hydratase family protein [Desulfoluna spongiiphila]|uniref:crotonase/enoyl-CoA hydratase family protein n=1 Tax=Desulfoluna spongiiphila TaxID=419481 RepID=UPI001253C3A8|nr:crotonase/enoyl-CoA hydratase family protein [Desulfoluna spongiiphila]VVS92732.1 enoyl-coa hydratase/isomerase [Desulfoluna spongiiphila]